MNIFLKNVGLGVILRKPFKIYLRKYEKYCVKYISSRSDPLYVIWMAAQAEAQANLLYGTSFKFIRLQFFCKKKS